MPQDDEPSEEEVWNALSDIALGAEQKIFEQLVSELKSLGLSEDFIQLYRDDFQSYVALQSKLMHSKPLPEVMRLLPGNRWLQAYRALMGKRKGRLGLETRELFVREIAAIIKKKREGTDKM